MADEPISIWPYDPSFALTVLATVLYGIVFFTIFYLTIIKYRAWFFTTIAVGAAVEVLGYALRCYSVKQPTQIVRPLTHPPPCFLSHPPSRPLPHPNHRLPIQQPSKSLTNPPPNPTGPLRRLPHPHRPIPHPHRRRQLPAHRPAHPLRPRPRAHRTPRLGHARPPADPRLRVL